MPHIKLQTNKWHAAIAFLFTLGTIKCEDRSPPIASASSEHSPVPIVYTKPPSDPPPAKPEPPVPPPSAVASWSASWPQFPGLAQGWTPLLSMPWNSPFPAAESVVPTKQQRDEQHVLEERATRSDNGTLRHIRQQQFVGVRVRFNPPTFEETARLFYSVFNHEAQHIQIRPQKQCFPEGCFNLHTFRISGFQRPLAITLRPLGPNLLLLNILSFDVDIESLLNGSVQLLLTSVPITGNFFATARQLSITALFDLQKDQHKVPYLRIASCELRSGVVSTKVTNLGLITDAINLKYKTEMLEKAKELITSTICETISDTIRERVNQVLRRLPRAISVAKIVSALSSPEADCAPSFPSHAVPPLPPLAFQMDSVPHSHRFFSNQLTLSYQQRQQQQQALPGWDGRFWRRTRRQRRAMEVIDDETDRGRGETVEEEVGEQRGEATVLEIVAADTQTVNATEKVDTEPPETVKPPTDIRTKETSSKQSTDKEQQKEKKVANNSQHSTAGIAECAQNSAALLDFLDLRSLDQVFLDMDFLDSSAGADFFAVGLSGDVFIRSPHQVSFVGGGVHELLALLGNAKGNSSSSLSAEEDKSLLLGDEDQNVNNNDFPPLLRFPNANARGHRKTLEIMFSDLTANLVLLQAHRAKLLKVHVGPGSPLFGPLLRTSCGLDEVCLSDTISEAGEKYPSEQLEIEVEPVQPPRIRFSKDMATLHVIGAATFFLARNHQAIGRIPFTATVELAVRTATPAAEKRANNASTVEGNANNGTTTTREAAKLEVSLAIPRLEILEDVDFFELSAASLDGFRDAVRGAIVNGAARHLGGGVPLDALERRLCAYGISQPGIQLLREGLALLSAELDAYILLFEGGSDSPPPPQQGVRVDKDCLSPVQLRCLAVAVECAEEFALFGGLNPSSDPVRAAALARVAKMGERDQSLGTVDRTLMRTRRLSLVEALNNGCIDIPQEDISPHSPSPSAEQRNSHKRRSRSQPGPRTRDPVATAAAAFASAAVQELSDFIDEDCCAEETATMSKSSNGNGAFDYTVDANATLWTGNGTEGTSAASKAKGGSCCSQDSGVRSSTHSAGSLTASSEEGDGHSRVPCCSSASSSGASSAPSGVLFLAEAVWEHVAMLRDELPFAAGEEVAVLDCPSSQLWYGVCGPRSGWFPASYVRPRNKELCRLCAGGQTEAMAKFDPGEGFPSPQMRLLRRRIVQELMSTEREYVKLLQNLVQGFVEQCRRRRELFPEERVQRIFGNLELIQLLHSRLLHELNAALDEKEPEQSALANVFLRNSQQFGIYTDYCNNRTLSCTELAALEQNAQYFHFFEACRLLRGMSELSLDGFLLTPVQRICRYPLQLLELLKATPAGHPDRLALELAQRTMRQVAAQVNDGKRRVDAIQKIWLWQKSVHGFRGPDLVESNHRMLINGELYCRALWRGQPQWAKGVHVYLFDQTVVLCRRDVLRRSQLVFKERMSLQGTNAQDVHDGKEPITGASLKNAFKLAGAAREYIFSCPDPATKGLWLEALRDRPRPQPPTPAERRLAMLM